MSGAPKLKRTNRRDKNVQDQCGWANRCRRDSEQRHRGDVTRRAGVPDGRIKKRDHCDCEAKKKEARVHVDLNAKRFLDLTWNDKNVISDSNSHGGRSSTSKRRAHESSRAREVAVSSPARA